MIFTVCGSRQTDRPGSRGQFVSLYTGDPSRLLPRPISLCEIDGAGEAASCTG